MRTVAIWLLVCVGFAVGQTDVGLRLKSAQVPKDNTNQCSATPSQTYPCMQDIALDGVRFSVVGYTPQTLRIEYLLTFDKHFITKEGLRVGSLVEIPEDKLLSIRGWHIYGPKTKDGWHIIVAVRWPKTRCRRLTAVELTPPIPSWAEFTASRLLGSKKAEFKPTK